MEEKIQARASLGSRLPKFGSSKPIGSYFDRTQNGTHIGLVGKSSVTSGDNKHSNLERTSVLQPNWKKLKHPPNEQIGKEPINSAFGKGHDAKTYSQSQITDDKHIPRLGGTLKTGQQNNMLVSQKEDLNENRLLTSTKFTKNASLGRTSYSGINGCKTQASGFYNSRPITGLQRPRANSVNRIFSNNVPDNIKSFSYVRRSQSFSHSLQNSLQPTTTLARSLSFNREIDPQKPYETHVALRTAPKGNLLSRSDRQYDLPNGNTKPLKSSFTRTYSAGSSSGIKKPNLSNGSVLASPLGYKMSRPSLLKTTRQQFPREIIIDGLKSSSDTFSLKDKMEPMPSDIERSANNKINIEEKVMDTCNFVLCDNLQKQESKDSYYGEDLDELSISSLSSSDKNDLSEDFSDDFIDLEDGNKTIIAVELEKSLTENLPSKNLLKSFQEKCIIDKTDDCIDIKAAVQNALGSTSSLFGEIRSSPDLEYRDQSSLELSPCDSSGGTYMWDEEGMEPLGNVDLCGSHESSEINSLDVLNNLETSDLEEDDLMLNIDLPEDTPSEIENNDNMNAFERTEWNVRQRQQGFWMWPPQRLFEHHLSNADHYFYGRGLACVDTPVERRENTVMLDEITLDHIVQGCVDVKNDLLKLQYFLQQENDHDSLQDLMPSSPITPERQESEPVPKTEDLLREIQQLKEEAKKKDETIQHLENQLTRCTCQGPKGEKPAQRTKYTQTSRRRNTLPILQYSNNILNFTDHSSGRLVTPLHIEDLSEFGPQCPSLCHLEENDANFSQIPELSDLLTKQLKIQDPEDNFEEIKKLEDETNEREHVNGDLEPQNVPSALLVTVTGETKNDLRSKLTVKTSTNQISRPKTLQLCRPKIQNTSTYHKPTNSSIAQNTIPTVKEPQAQTKTSCCLPQLSNGSQSVVQKKSQPQSQKDCSVSQPSTYVASSSISGSSQTLCAPKDQTLSSLSKHNRRLPNLLPPSTGSSKVQSIGSLPPQQVPTADTSRQTNRQSPKTSMLRPPSNFASKLKKPSSPKTETMQPIASNEPPKTQLRSPSVLRPASNKKEVSQEAGESSGLKRQSRLPQPKTH
ncbi:serine-rich coiled-coil domain-containing protein 2 isoform X2 [Bombina bombina]|uniref:serine-rich coiled-coil domain-containing protein 2 isoform X2 n=1 Tax=Bombina bombina TaxID=8345 RepID=UPI00235A571E|nr:serine-rich coiled-coil domain-containing protein 2 isoform X2 [Bombina bombina]